MHKSILLILAIVALLVVSGCAQTPSPPPIPLEDCALYFDGCNNCNVVNGQITKCTKMACKVYQQPRCVVPAQIDLLECKRYFDGCNDCDVINGEITACTEKACMVYEEPRCLESI